MKYKKYIVILLIALFIGCNNAYALTAGKDNVCYYKSDDLKLYVVFSENKNGNKNQRPYTNDVRIMEKNGKSVNFKDAKTNIYDNALPVTGVKVEKIELKKSGNEIICPEYTLVAKRKQTVFFYDLSTTKKYLNLITAKEKDAVYASNVSSEDFWGKLCKGSDCILGEDIELNCSNLFNSKDENGESLGSMINDALKYIRIIVPILIIILGTFDLAKAVIASKPDEMKKAQSIFIKRLIAGIAVFFVPLLINIIMALTDSIWESAGYTTCEVEKIK